MYVEQETVKMFRSSKISLSNKFLKNSKNFLNYYSLSEKKKIIPLYSNGVYNIYIFFIKIGKALSE